MALARKTARPLTFDDYLAFADTRPQEEDWELIEGELVLMVRPIPDHAQIVMNIAVALRSPMDRRGRRVLADVLVRNRDKDDFALAPDLLVRCGSPGRERFVTDPVVVIEVLSPSTMDYDRGRKLELYKSFGSVAHIVLAYQTEWRVETISRDGENWTMAVADAANAVLALPSVEFSMSLSDVYYGVEDSAA